MKDASLERLFPRLAAEGYRVTSPKSVFYNCYAWAAGDTIHWWEPGKGMRNYYWPPALSAEHTLENYIRVFATVGFVLCDSSELEAGFEKIALFVDEERNSTHAARQLVSGVWTSKLGFWEDIEHNTLTALEGDVYGTVAQILRRPRKDIP